MEGDYSSSKYFGACRFFRSNPSLFMKEDSVNLNCIRRHILQCIASLHCYEKFGVDNVVSSRGFYSALANIIDCLSDNAVSESSLSTLFLFENFLSTRSLNDSDNDDSVAQKEDYMSTHWAVLTSSIPVEQKLAAIAEARKKPNGIPVTRYKAHMIHYAAASGFIEVAKAVASPAAIRCKDANGRVPLHWAAMHSRSLEMLNYLLEEWPAATNAHDKDGYTPLHRLLARKSFPEQASMVDRIVDTDPAVTKNGKTALHLFCESVTDCDGSDPPCITLFEKLLAAYPGAVSHKDCKGQVPLHYLCSNNRLKRKLPLLKLLLAAYKEGASVMSKYNYLPAHFAISKLSIEEFDILINAYPDALSRDANIRANLLSIAAGEEVLQYVLQRNPEPARVSDHYRRKLPFHGAVESSSDLQWVQLLYSAYPEAIRLSTFSGCLPLHYALRDTIHSSTSKEADIVRFLLRHHPEAVNMTHVPDEDQQEVDWSGPGPDEDFGEFNELYPMWLTPYKLSLSTNCCEYIQRILLRACPAADPQRLRELNYQARRQLMFLAFAGITDFKAAAAAVTAMSVLKGVSHSSNAHTSAHTADTAMKSMKTGTDDFIYQLRRLMNIGEEMGLLRHIASYL